MRISSKEVFEKRYGRRLMKEFYKPGELVLVRNSSIEYSADRKHKPRYEGPFEVVRKTKGGSYILKELDGSIRRQGVAAFRLLRYYTRDDQDAYAKGKRTTRRNPEPEDDEDIDL